MGTAPGRAVIGPATLATRARDVLEASIASIGRVHAARLGELERDQVAEHHRPEQPRGAGLALGLDRDAPRRRARSARRSARTGGAPADAGRGPRGRRLRSRSLGRAGPAADLVVVGLRQLGGEGRQLRVLVDLGLPARRPAPSARRRRSTGTRAREPRGELGGARPQRLRRSLEGAAAAVDLGAMRGATPASAATSAATTNM